MDYGDYYWGLYSFLLQGFLPPFPNKHQAEDFKTLNPKP